MGVSISKYTPIYLKHESRKPGIALPRKEELRTSVFVSNYYPLYQMRGAVSLLSLLLASSDLMTAPLGGLKRFSNFAVNARCKCCHQPQ
jgi:hypothetical protein